MTDTSLIFTLGRGQTNKLFAKALCVTLETFWGGYHLKFKNFPIISENVQQFPRP